MQASPFRLGQKSAGISPHEVKFCPRQGQKAFKPRVKLAYRSHAELNRTRTDGCKSRADRQPLRQHPLTEREIFNRKQYFAKGKKDLTRDNAHNKSLSPGEVFTFGKHRFNGAFDL